MALVNTESTVPARERRRSVRHRTPAVNTHLFSCQIGTYDVHRLVYVIVGDSAGAYLTGVSPIRARRRVHAMPQWHIRISSQLQTARETRSFEPPCVLPSPGYVRARRQKAYLKKEGTDQRSPGQVSTARVTAWHCTRPHRRERYAQHRRAPHRLTSTTTRPVVLPERIVPACAGSSLSPTVAVLILSTVSAGRSWRCSGWLVGWLGGVVGRVVSWFDGWVGGWGWLIGWWLRGWVSKWLGEQ